MRGQPIVGELLQAIVCRLPIKPRYVVSSSQPVSQRLHAQALRVDRSEPVSQGRADARAGLHQRQRQSGFVLHVVDKLKTGTWTQVVRRRTAYQGN